MPVAPGFTISAARSQLDVRTVPRRGRRDRAALAFTCEVLGMACKPAAACARTGDRLNPTPKAAATACRGQRGVVAYPTPACARGGAAASTVAVGKPRHDGGTGFQGAMHGTFSRNFDQL